MCPLFSGELGSKGRTDDRTNIFELKCFSQTKGFDSSLASSFSYSHKFLENALQDVNQIVFSLQQHRMTFFCKS